MDSSRFPGYTAENNVSKEMDTTDEPNFEFDQSKD